MIIKKSEILLEPLGDRVLAELVVSDVQKVGMLYIPEAYREKSCKCRVIFLGTGRTTEHGVKIPIECAVGDVVLVTKYGGTEVEYGGKSYKILESSDILCIVRGEV